MTDQIDNPEEKLRHYRRAADEAERSAKLAKDEDVRMAYLAIMRTWIYLADELEREMAHHGTEMSVREADDVFVPSPPKDAMHKSR